MIQLNELLKNAVQAYKEGNLNKSISLFKKILVLDPNNPDALFNISSIYNKLEKYKDSKPYLQRYLKIVPNSWEAIDMLADVYFSEGNYEKSLELLLKLPKIVPNNLIENLNDKIENIKERISIAQTQIKISFISLRGLDNFIDDIIRELSIDYWVRKFVVVNKKDIYDAIDWGDLIWFEWANESAITGSNYDKLISKPAIIRLHSYEALAYYPLKINWFNINKVIFVADHIRDIVETYIPNLKELTDIEIINNGINLEHIPFKERKKGFNIAWVAHISYKKNPPMMLQIVKKLMDIDSRFKLHIAGDFQDLRYELYLKNLIREMNLQNNVLFYGWVDDMDSWWKDKNYLLSTSVHEGHPYNIMEGMARGIKPVIHNFKGSKNLFPNYLIFNTIDEATRIILNKVYESEKYRNFIERHYTFQKQMESIKEVIERLLSHKSDKFNKNFSKSSNLEYPSKQELLNKSQTKDKETLPPLKYYNRMAKIMEKAYDTLSESHKHIFSVLDTLQLTDKNVLEVGCGIGVITKYLCEHSHKVHSIDISPEMLKTTQKYVNAKNLTLELLDIVKDPIHGKYDCIILADVLEHLGNKNLPKVFSKVKNALNPKGLIYINIPYGRYNNFWKKYNPKKLQIIDEIIDPDLLFSLSKNEDLFPVYVNLYGIDFPYQYFEVFLVNFIDIEDAYKSRVSQLKI